jgi:hypothetical protein
MILRLARRWHWDGTWKYDETLWTGFSWPLLRVCWWALVNTTLYLIISWKWPLGCFDLVEVYHNQGDHPDDEDRSCKTSVNVYRTTRCNIREHKISSYAPPWEPEISQGISCPVKWLLASCGDGAARSWQYCLTLETRLLQCTIV